MAKRIGVVGAGPAGASAALDLARRGGYEVLIFERYNLPRTKVCGSGLSPWTLKELDDIGLGAEVRKRAYRIDGARIAGSKPVRPGQEDGVEVRGEHETAIMLRSDFDKLLVDHACASGAQLMDGVRVQKLHRDRVDALAIETSAGLFEVDAIVDASGARGGFHREANPSGTLHTMLGWYEGIEGQTDVVELYFDETVKPHYGWVFPESENLANVGICFDPERGELNARERFEAFVERRLGRRMRGASLKGKLVGHPAHTSAVPGRLVHDGVLVAGEAGQLVDRATAEGIYHALVSGRLASEALARAFEAGKQPTRKVLRGYQTAVQKALTGRLMLGATLTQALRTSALDFVLGYGAKPSVRRVLRRSFAGLYHG